MAEHTKHESTAKKPESAMKHIASFVVMIGLTALAFYLVISDAVPEGWILPGILILAAIQVFLQLFIFMHLDQKGTGFYTFMLLSGILIAVVSAVGIMFL